MIVEYLIKIFLIVTMIIVVQTAYNTFVYRQIGKLKWIKFGAVSLMGLVIGTGLISLVKDFTKLPFLTSIVSFIDTVIFAFFGYISSNLLLLWFVVPIMIIWIVYILKTIVAVIINRIKFNRWKKENREDEQEQSIPEDIKEMQEEFPLLKNEEVQNKENIHFLEGIPTTNIRFNSILGLQRAYEIAKKKGLQIGETETGYVAVYANAEGIKQLKSIFNDNGIKITGLENRPSIVLFNKKVEDCVTIKMAMGIVKAGGKFWEM